MDSLMVREIFFIKQKNVKEKISTISKNNASYHLVKYQKYIIFIFIILHKADYIMNSFF